jgi:hypothetical protein
MSAKNEKESARQYVLVEAIQQYRMRYVVELGKDDPAAWALDTVTMNEAKELSQQDLGETIVSHRVLPGGLEEAIALARTDNPSVAAHWPADVVIRNHITPRPAAGETPEVAPGKKSRLRR